MSNEFVHAMRQRIDRDRIYVRLLPDPLGGQFTLCMHPEQAEQMAYHILALAREARAERAANYPGFYPVEKGKVVDG